MVKDLRDWIAALRSNGLLSDHKETVDVRNCSEIIFQNYKSATLFQNVVGYKNRVLANSVSSREMMALALGSGLHDILEEYLRRISHPIPPSFEKLKSPRSQQIVLDKPSEVDLTSLPILLQHEFDGGPYISAGVVLARDQESSEYNIGIYRLMFRTRNELGINITAPHKLRWIYEKAFERKKPLEVAVCLGLHALDLLAAVTSSPGGVDELALWGGLQDSPIRMVKCKTIDLFVPEHAEMVLEGTMDPTGWVEPEGMYGEFPGTYSGMRKNPFLKIKAITSRRGAIYQSATHGGRRLAHTDFFVIIPQIELSILQALRNAGIDARQVRIVEESAGMICYVSIEPRTLGDSRNALNVILTGSRQNFPKYAAVFDSDIDVFDEELVIWAIATRSQPREDAMILDGLRIPSSSDPSLLPGVRTMSKLGIDATIPFGAEKARFVHSKPPKAERYVAGRIGEEEIKKTEKEIEDYLRKKGPSFFYEVAVYLRTSAYRSVLRSWGNLRERNSIEEGMDGRYSLKQNGERDKKFVP